MKISERVELYYLQRYKKKTKRVEPVGEIAALCKVCTGRCKTSVNIVVCPGKMKFEGERQWHETKQPKIN